jgi:serine/threonine protein kinase
MVGLSDFGLASIISSRGEQTASREALTPAYSSPETFRGEEPTVLADVYELAATLYALLAGRPPRFAADGRQPGFATIMSLHGRPVEDVPGTPPELMALLRAGLSPDPAARPQSAAGLRDALTDPRRYAAAALRVARARCPASPECFAGIVTSAGSSTARPLGCDQPHTWETFAIAILPITVRTFDQPVVAADPTVRLVCSQAVMLSSRQGQARRLPAPDWDIAVLPPSEAAFGSGSHVYRCLAYEVGHQPHVSQFRR